MFAVVLLNCSCSVDCYVVFHVLYALSLSCCCFFVLGRDVVVVVCICCVFCCSMLVLGGGVFFCCHLLFDVFYVFPMFVWFLATRLVVWFLFMCSLPALLVYRGFLHVVSYMPVVTKYCLYLVC